MKLEDIISIVLILGVFPITILLIIFQIQKAKIKERIQLIEKGFDISSMQLRNNPFYNMLMWGMLCVGVGFGLLIGLLLIEYSIFINDTIMGILAILFGGISLIIYYFADQKENLK